MKIIVLRSAGAARSLTLTRKWVVALGTLFLSSFSALGLALYLNLDREIVDAEVVDQWRDRLHQQANQVRDIKRQSEQQRNAIGKQLAEMQARLLRMEAIGAHLADSAELEDGEFDFALEPAQGGPVHPLTDERAGSTGLMTELDALAERLKQREMELSILDSVLVGEDIHTKSQVRGRPVKWGWLTSKYGKRMDPISGKNAWHSGVDFAGRDGSDVIAVASGIVTYAGPRYGYGQLVEISHADGLVTRYAHHKSLEVKVGDVVKKGDVVGKMGSSGRSTGPHVHFEVLKHGRTVDPINYVSKRS